MTLRFLAFAVASLSLVPGAFAWTTLQGNGEVFVRHETPQYNIELRCNSGNGNVLNFTLGRTGGRTFGNVRSVMLWIEAPDGRLARRSIDVVNRGQYVNGEWNVSDLVLDEFRNAKSLEVALNGQDIVLRTNMKGTGAARLAFKEQCGF